MRELILSKIRAKLGLDRVRWPLSGTAPIPPHTLAFFAGLGIPIAEIWGMSELSCICSVSQPRDGDIVSIDDDGYLTIVDNTALIVLDADHIAALYSDHLSDDVHEPAGQERTPSSTISTAERAKLIIRSGDLECLSRRANSAAAPMSEQWVNGPDRCPRTRVTVPRR